MTIQENIDLIYAELMRIKLSLGGESGDVSEEIAELNDAVAALEVKDAAQDGKIADNTENINNIDGRESAHYSELSRVTGELNSQIHTNTVDISDNKADIAALEADTVKKTTTINEVPLDSAQIKLPIGSKIYEHVFFNLVNSSLGYGNLYIISKRSAPYTQLTPRIFGRQIGKKQDIFSIYFVSLQNCVVGLSDPMGTGIFKGTFLNTTTGEIYTKDIPYNTVFSEVNEQVSQI